MSLLTVKSAGDQFTLADYNNIVGRNNERVEISSLPYIVTTSTSVTEIQAIIDANSVNGAYIYLHATQIDVGNTPLVINASSNITLNGRGRCEIYSATGSVLLLLSGGVINNVRVTGIKFRSTKTGGGGAMVFSTELAQINRWELDHCTFTAPLGAFNAIGVVQYSTGSSSGQTSYDLDFHHNTGTNIGRMFCEVLSQGYDDVYRIQGFKFWKNSATNLGVNDQYGMMISLSGLMEHISIDDNRVVDANKIAYEVVNCRDISITNNKSKWINNTFVGISLSDDSRSTTHGVTITGNNIRSKDNVFQLFGVQNWTATGNTFINTVSSDQTTFNGGRVYIAQNFNGVGQTTSEGIFAENIVKVASRKGIEVDNATFNRFENNIVSTIYYTGASERVTIRNGLATGNVVVDNIYIKNAANSNLVDVNETGGANANVIKIITDFLLHSRSVSVATTSGTAIVLTHNFGANTGIDRIIGYEAGTRVSVDIPFDVTSMTNTQVTINPIITTTYTAIIIIGNKLQ